MKHTKPPQKVHVTPHGEVNKTFLISIVSVVLIVALGLFLFFSDQLVGQATHMVGDYQVDFDLVGQNLEVNINTLTDEVNGIYFELSGGPTCDNLVDATSGFSGEFLMFECVDNVIHYGDAEVDPAQFVTGDLSFQIEFTGLTGDNNFRFDNLELLNTVDGTNILADAVNVEDILTVPAEQEEEQQQQQGSPGRGGGSGGSCTSQWSCSTWSLCNKTLQQSKVCNDLRRCNQNRLTRTEVQNCSECQESWVCGEWSSCTNNKQTRTCTDEHHCDTVKDKPALQQSCTATTTTTQRSIQQQTGVRAPPVPPTQPRTPPQVQEPTGEFSFKETFDEYKTLIIGIPGGLILLIIIILLLLHIFKPKQQLVYNFDELKDWIGKERAMGTSDMDIKHILAQNTGWTHEDIEKTFTELATVKQLPVQ